MDDLSFYDLQSGTTRSEVNLLRRFLLAPDTVPWPCGSKRVSVCCSPDLNHVRTPEDVYGDTQGSDCQRTVQRCKEELTIWFPSEAIPGIKDHPGCRGDGALSRACCLHLGLGTSTADLSLSSARMTAAHRCFLPSFQEKRAYAFQEEPALPATFAMLCLFSSIALWLPGMVEWVCDKDTLKDKLCRYIKEEIVNTIHRLSASTPIWHLFSREEVIFCKQNSAWIQFGSLKNFLLQFL